MKKKLTYFISAWVLIAVTIVSCKKQDPPTATIHSTIDDYSVTFSADVTNTSTYLWDFGDGTSTNIAADGVSHTARIRLL